MDNATAEIIKIIIDTFGADKFDKYDKIRINKLSGNKIFSEDEDVLNDRYEDNLNE